MAGCDNWSNILDETFHMARKTLGMVVPSPKTKKAVRMGSPHSRLVSRYASKEEGPATCLTLESARAREAVECAARAGTLTGTAEEIGAYGFQGRNLSECKREQEFTDQYISPYRQPPPQIEHDQPPPELKTMRKPTVGIIDYKKKPKVWLKRKTLKVSFPADEPVGAAMVEPQMGELLERESPNRKPWDWPCEEEFPGSKKPEKVISNLKYRVERIKRKWAESRKDAVRSREPRIGQEKRYGNLACDSFFPPHSYTVYRRKKEEEDFALKALRKDWAQRHKRRLFTSETSPVCEPPEEQDVYETPMNPPGTSCAPQSPGSGSPLFEVAEEFIDYAQDTVRNLDPSQLQGGRSPNVCETPEPSTWV